MAAVFMVIKVSVSCRSEIACPTVESSGGYLAHKEGSVYSKAFTEGGKW